MRPRAVRDIEDHGIGQFTDAADRWSRRRLRRRQTQSFQTDESAQNDRA
jgi:hypothetical protein